MPAEVTNATDVIAALARMEHELCDPDADVDALVVGVTALDERIRASASAWSTDDGQRVLHRFTAVLALAVERRSTVLTAIEHQTSGRRAVARYQAR